MNSIALTPPAALLPDNSRVFWHRLELGVIAFFLVALNWPLLHGACNSALIFLPEAVAQGEWWRVLSHPFIHVTWFHLLLDGTAFFLLYKDLQQGSWIARFTCVLASASGSLVVCICADPLISVKGLCGISGIAHGLMVVSALELMKQRSDKLLFRIGLLSFGVVVVKCLIEVLTGKMLFTFIYFGMVGDPVAVTHAGGVLGGLVGWWLQRGINRDDS